MGSVLTIILTLVTSGIFIAAGRMVFSHSGLARLNSTPLACFFGGLGVWYLWVLLLGGILGASLPIVWYTFLASVIGLTLVLTKVLNLEEEHAFFWPQVALGCLLLLPAFGYLTTDGPVLWAELSQYLKNTDHMLRLGHIVNAAKAQEMDIFNPTAHLASQIVNLPVMLMMNAFKPAVATLFNCVVLVLAAAELARMCRVHVGWHNVVFVAAISLFGVTIFNPFFQEALVFSAYPDILMAGVLFALFVPLIRGQDLPQGISTIPYGLLGVYAIACSNTGAGLMVIWFILFVLRDTVSRLRLKQGFGLNVLLGWGVLGLLPTLGSYLGSYETLNLGFPLQEATGHTPWLKLVALQTAEMLGTWPIITILLIGFPLLAAYTLVRKGFYNSLTTDSHLFIPGLVMFTYIVVAGGLYLTGFDGDHKPFGEGFIHYALHLQFLVLLPLWRLAYDVLRATFPSTNKGVSGTLSLVAALMFVGVTVTNAERLKFEPAAPLDHTLRVAEALKADNVVGWREKVAVVDGADTRGYYAVALGYGLRHYAQVRPALQELADAQGSFDKFHDSLIAGGYDYLWVHTVTPDIAAVLGNQLRLDYSYLYKVTPTGLNPLKSYAHGAYTYKSASYIPQL